MNLHRGIRNIEWPIIAIVFALFIVSWPYMRSASYQSAPEGQGTYTSSPEKQIVWVAIGAVIAAVLLIPSYRTITGLSIIFYMLSLLILALMLLPPPLAILPVRTINGAASWLELDPRIRFQPSELAKIATILALARHLSLESQVRRFYHIIGGLFLVAAPAVLIAAQPDLGTAMLLWPAAAGMILVSGARIKHLFILALIAVLLLPALWLVMNNTQKSRITTWLRQDQKLTRVERVGQFHHLRQSKIAIGSGRWTGKGLGEGTQNRLNYLAFRNTDFIFAVICEEGGFVMANIIILLYLLLAGTGFGLARRCREPEGRLLVVGITLLIVVQALINIGMTLGGFPIVGITLPFVSYGGSSTLSSFIAISLLLNVGLRRPDVTFSRTELSDLGGEFDGELR